MDHVATVDMMVEAIAPRLERQKRIDALQRVRDAAILKQLRKANKAHRS